MIDRTALLSTRDRIAPPHKSTACSTARSHIEEASEKSEGRESLTEFKDPSHPHSQPRCTPKTLTNGSTPRIRMSLCTPRQVNTNTTHCIIGPKQGNQWYGNNTSTNSETSTGHTETKPPDGEKIKLQLIDAAQNNYNTSETE